MKLVDEIIEMAADGKKPLADVLRKCLILSFSLKNDTLKVWVVGVTAGRLACGRFGSTRRCGNSFGRCYFLNR
jgi:hypothetical protein